jgi:adenylate cyclase
MDRIWQWAWNRYRARYMRVLYAIGFAVTLPVYLLLTLLIAAFEKSGH